MISRIGIVGFGRFGKLAAKYLKRDFKVLVTDIEDKQKEAKEIGVEYVTLDEVCSCDVVLLCVPISSLEGVLREIRNLLKEGCLVIDVCSVKEIPCRLMKEILPENVEILGSHPLFGPDSASESLLGRKIVLCPIRISEESLSKVKRFLTSKGLKIIQTTPVEHDMQIAKSLILTHFIGRALLEIKVSEQEIDTLGYRRLLEILETVKHDTWQLFIDVNRYNRFSDKVRKSLIEALEKLDKMIEGA